jgi:hypothetical protein
LKSADMVRFVDLLWSSYEAYSRSLRQCTIGAGKILLVAIRWPMFHVTLVRAHPIGQEQSKYPRMQWFTSWCIGI